MFIFMEIKFIVYGYCLSFKEPIHSKKLHLQDWMSVQNNQNVSFKRSFTRNTYKSPFLCELRVSDFVSLYHGGEITVDPQNKTKHTNISPYKLMSGLSSGLSVSCNLILPLITAR